MATHPTTSSAPPASRSAADGVDGTPGHVDADAGDLRTSVSLKEWGAAIHGLLDGRQTILLRKGGIHEKAFTVPAGGQPDADGGGFLLFPTVAHSHAERTREAHQDLLAPGAEDVRDGALVIRAAAQTLGVVEVTRPDRLAELEDLHIWTTASIITDRVEFRPAKPLQILVVRAIALDAPLHLPRLETYGGCTSWIDLQVPPAWSGTAVHDDARLLADLDRVRSTVG